MRVSTRENFSEIGEEVARLSRKEDQREERTGKSDGRHDFQEHFQLADREISARERAYSKSGEEGKEFEHCWFRFRVTQFSEGQRVLCKKRASRDDFRQVRL